MMDTSDKAGTRPFGPDAVTILATEHWSLLGTRSLLWTEAVSRTTIFLAALSAAIIALALLADATGFGRRTTAFALVLLPVVFLLGLATYLRLVQINTDEKQTVLAMNRLRNAYLRLEPDLEPFFTTSQHDDEQGFATTYSLTDPTGRPRAYFLVTTPTVVATVDAALAAAIVALGLQAAEAAGAVVVVAGSIAFLAVWAGLFSVQRRTLDPLRRTVPRFPTPPGRS
jgi:hypothetical protein